MDLFIISLFISFNSLTALTLFKIKLPIKLSINVSFVKNNKNNLMVFVKSFGKYVSQNYLSLLALFGATAQLLFESLLEKI